MLRLSSHDEMKEQYAKSWSYQYTLYSSRGESKDKSDDDDEFETGARYDLK